MATSTLTSSPAGATDKVNVPANKISSKRFLEDKGSIIDCTRNAVGACLIAVTAAMSPAQAATPPQPGTSLEYTIDATKTAPMIQADLIKQFGLAPETAKTISELSADNLERIKRGEIKPGDIVLHIRAIDRNNLARELGNDLSLAPLKTFMQLTGETEMNVANHEKIITALFDTSDVSLWLRKYGGVEYTQEELASYKKQKTLELSNNLKRVKEMIADGSADKMFRMFNADMKTMTVAESREAFRILYVTETSVNFGETLYASSDEKDEKRKDINSANLTSQTMTRALLTRRDFPAGGAKFLIGANPQTAVTHMVPTPLQRAEMTKGPGAISERLATSIDRVTTVWTKGYKNNMDPILAKGQSEVLVKDIAKGREDIAKGREDIAKLDGNIAKLDGNIAKGREDIAKGREDIANIQKIGAIREDINTLLRSIMQESDPINQKSLIDAYNQKMKEFQVVRASLERDSADTKTASMLAAINADIAIIRSHPKLKPLDNQLAKFTLPSKI